MSWGKVQNPAPIAVLENFLLLLNALQVCHSSKQWNGLLRKFFGVDLRCYFDTQQAWHLMHQLKCQLGKGNPTALKNSEEASLALLLQKFHLYHPARQQCHANVVRWVGGRVGGWLQASCQVAYCRTCKCKLSLPVEL